LDSCKDARLKRRVEEIFDLLKKDIGLGVKISKDRWPRSYVKRWGLRNLYKCNLGRDWRMIYTLVFDGAGIGVLALEVLSHKQYDKLFGYGTT